MPEFEWDDNGFCRYCGWPWFDHDDYQCIADAQAEALAEARADRAREEAIYREP